MQAPGKFIAAMCVDCLEQPAYNPHVHGQNVEIACDSAPQDWRTNGPETQDHNLDRRRVFGSHAKWSGVLMVNFMNILIQRTPVKCAMRPVVPRILDHKKDRDLIRHRKKGRKGHAGGKSEKLGHRMEQPNSISRIL